jgi:drug/metabolite transporter (DMT)-like permease
VTAKAGTAPAKARSAESSEGHALAILALITTATIWGTTAIATKVVLDTYTPFILSTGRWLLSLLIMVPIMLGLGVRPLLDRRSAFLGLFGILGFNMFFTFGLERTSAANGSLIGGALPVVVASISFLVLRERLPVLALVGIVASMTGVVFTIVGSTLDASILGNLLVFGAVLSWAIYTIYNRQRMRGENTMSIVAGSAIFGVLMMLPLAAVEWIRDAPPPPDLEEAAIILYLSLGPAIGANFLWVFALSRVSASHAAVFSNVSPIVGIVLAGLILDEPITRYHVIGSMLVLLGVWLTTWRRQPRER